MTERKEALNQKIVNGIASNPYATDMHIPPFADERDATYPYSFITGGFGAFALTQAKHNAEQYALSYRDFNVGVFAAVWSDRFQTMATIGGANFKPDETQQVKICAEEILFQKIQNGGFTLMSLLAVVGPVQEDTQSERLASTLHPCGLCRAKLERSDVVDPDTLILSATPDLETIELTTVTGLLSFHENGDSSQISTFHLGPDFKGWDETAQPMIDAHVNGVVFGTTQE